MISGNETIEMPTECACEDGSTMNPTELLENEIGQANTIKKIRKARKNVKKVFKTCRPMSCTCANGDENVITMFGCSNGGVPKCENGKKKLFCSGGEKVNPLKVQSTNLFDSQGYSDWVRHLELESLHLERTI